MVAKKRVSLEEGESIQVVEYLRLIAWLTDNYPEVLKEFKEEENL